MPVLNSDSKHMPLLLEKNKLCLLSTWCRVCHTGVPSVSVDHSHCMMSNLQPASFSELWVTSKEEASGSS